MILNFLVALQEKYGTHWEDSTNAFRYAAGFVGAIDFFKLKMIPYCNGLQSFTVKTVSDSLRLDKSNLVLQSEVKGFGGKDAPKKIYDRLVDAFRPAGGKTPKFEM